MRNLVRSGSTLVLIFACLAVAGNARAQCFHDQIAQQKTVSADEKSFTFQPTMHLCDGNGYTSGQITNAVVLLVRTQREVMKAEKAETATFVYFEFNYDFYNGSGTWAGYQPVILTVQDKDHNDLLPQPIANDNTPRDVCIYGHTVPYRKADALSPNLFDQIEFITLSVPRVTGVQHGC
jgi:hypothetical protein